MLKAPKWAASCWTKKKTPPPAIWVKGGLFEHGLKNKIVNDLLRRRHAAFREDSLKRLKTDRLDIVRITIRPRTFKRQLD